ncbi:FtsX-like permease family protein [Streptomyces sp. DSM 44915]|uniref:FtsX-like permease family protein n=1 Tax=Streptomyces chisholmiae TaxID=3075540 RepID=A0ABU2JZT5_9ACTN|nr:FtsX-like permease family protein [Streptomyces sp. DSM 44915]MDT0270479.1 FtsX-like permease family protein [Streptomyces sp. DSM 44915]
MTVLKTSLRSFFAHKWRMLLSGMAVVLSVAFVCGTLVFTATMNNTFDKLFEINASSVVVSPAESDLTDDFTGGMSGTGKPETIPGSLQQELAELPGVEQSIGSILSTSTTAIDQHNESVSPTTGAPTLAANWSAIDERTMTITEGAAPEGADQVMVDADTADKSDLAVGDPLRLLTAFGDFELTISGIAEFETTNPGAALVYLDTPTAQEFLLGGDADLTNIYVDSDGSVTDEALKESVAALVGADTYKLQTADEYIQENSDATGEALAILEYVLLGFAGLALLVGIFLIVNTFSMLVAQRTREIGLLRAIGSSRRQINRSVLIEALLLGVIASLLGFGVGIGLAVGLMALMSALGINMSTDDLLIEPSVPVIGLVLGVLVTLVAAYIPARRAGRISPMAALRDAGMPGDVRAGRIRATLGGVMTVLGLGLLAMTATTDDAVVGAQFLAVGILLSLIGLITVGPALVGLVVRGLSVILLRGFGPIGRLAERNALRNPRRTGATATALMIGLSLVASLSVVGSSMVASASEGIDNSLGADYVVNTSNFSPVMPEVSNAIADIEELEHVTEYRMIETEVTLESGETFEMGAGAVAESFASDVTMDLVDGDLAEAYAPGAVSIGEAEAEEYGLGLGDQVTIAFDGGGETSLTVRAIVATGGAVFSSSWLFNQQELVDNATEVPLPMSLYLGAVEGQEEAARAALDSVIEVYPQIDVRDQAEFKELVEGQVGQLLNMVYGLLALAIIVAVLGVVNTLALSVVERTREIGLMRAIGLSRLQLRRMIRLESVVIALFGALLGLGLGMAWGAAGQQLLALEGMPVLEIPWGTIIGVFIGAAVVGLLAALLPAFRAGRMNVLNAIATD